MKMKTPILMASIVLLACSETRAVMRVCGGHNGIVRYDREGGYQCGDGTIDKAGGTRHASSAHASRHHRSAHTHVVAFKPTPDRGQILSPGEKPPETSLRNSH